MRVCHLITRLILGGAQENTLLTCAGLQARGHEVLLLTGNPAGSAGRDGELLELARAGGYRVEIVPSLYRSIHPWRDWQAAREIGRLLSEFRPQVVHTHTSKAGILGRETAHRLGVPAVVHTIHGLSFNRTQTVPVRAFYRALERRAARQSQALIAVCQAMVEQSLAAGVGRKEQYRVIYSGMETDAWLNRRSSTGVNSQESEENAEKPKRRNAEGEIEGRGPRIEGDQQSPDHPITRSPDPKSAIIQNSEFRIQNSEFSTPSPDACTIGTIARLFPNKGHDDLLALLAELNRRGRLTGPFSPRRPRLQFVWIGDGPLHSRLEQELAHRGLAEHVQLRGLVPRDELPRHMANLDLVVHTSRWEGLPRVLVQALLSGAPVIAWDLDGNPEVCQDGVTGRCVPPGNIPALADAVEQLAGQPDLRRRYAAAGRAWCLPRFSAVTMVEQIEDLYRELQ